MNKKFFLFILVPALFLGFYGLERGDLVNDEVFYAFRAIGPLDFDEAALQTTPLEWFDPQIPWWTSISFHDHPPLVFWVQHFFIKTFGENNTAFRLPSAILGIVSVYLLYLIGRRLFLERVGFVAALLYAVTLNHVYISRVGMQEAYVIFFILLSSYLFLKSLEDDSYLIWTGAALGLAFLTKYNSFILVPIFITYLLFHKREYFLNKKFWLAGAMSLLLFSPVIIYNIELYRAVGHFDFQFSYIFGQHPEVWKVAPGKEIGTLKDRLRDFLPRLVNSNSWVFLSLFATSFLAFLISLKNSWRETAKKYSFLIISFIFLTILLLKIGPSFRFLTMLTPFMALAGALFLDHIYTRFFSNKQRWGYILFGTIIFFEVLYSFNNQVAYYPVGPTPWLSSKVRYENYNWGYNELGNYLDTEFTGKMPALTLDSKYKFLESLRDTSIDADITNNLRPDPFLIVYGGNFDNGPKIWDLQRYFVYHAWPMMSIEDYTAILQKNGSDYFQKLGFQNFYFIIQTNIVLPPEWRAYLGATPSVIIKNKREDAVFQVYKIVL